MMLSARVAQDINQENIKQVLANHKIKVSEITEAADFNMIDTNNFIRIFGHVKAIVAIGTALALSQAKTKTRQLFRHRRINQNLSM